MDRETSRAIESDRPRAEGPVLPSRRSALDRLLPALRRGPVLISGEPGSGKTWLARALADEAGDTLAWVEVDVSPAADSSGLFGSIGLELGLGPAADRASIAAALADSSADGRAWGLRVDEAQNAPAEVLEEVRLLGNRLGRPDGFAAIVLVAQTSLVRKLGLRALGALESRLSAHAHLAPIDVEEAEALLGYDPVDAETIEAIHRSSLGNPARLLRLARLSRPEIRPEPIISARSAALGLDDGPGPLIPSRPPLRIEDGLIEVGYDSEAEAADRSSAAIASGLDPIESTEPILDPYATLQARAEWARVRNASESAEGIDPSGQAEIDDEIDEAADLSTIRAEGEQEFAPYSQLFARRARLGERAGSAPREKGSTSGPGEPIETR